KAVLDRCVFGQLRVFASQDFAAFFVLAGERGLRAAAVFLAGFAAGTFAAVLAAAGAFRCGRAVRRLAGPPPVLPARASSSATASSSVIVSGTLSGGSVALMPSCVT